MEKDKSDFFVFCFSVFLMYTSGSKDLREVSKGRRYGKC